jgi:hypothetical protein
MTIVRLVCFAIMATGLAVNGANAGPLESCCQVAARQKGYTGAKQTCYASVCAQYTTLQPGGRTCLASGAQFRAYQLELNSRCGIQR